MLLLNAIASDRSPGFLARAAFVWALFLGSCSWLAPEPDPVVNASLDENTQVGIQVLRGKVLQQQLTEQWRLQVPKGPHTFGDVIKAEVVLNNPFGQPFTVIEPPSGYMIEFSWRVERWMPFASSEVLHRKHVASFDRLLDFAEGQVIRYPVDLPVGQKGEASAVWRLSLTALMRCDGLQMDGEEFPVPSIPLRSSRLLVLPGNWQTLANKPFTNLERLITIADPQVDRHLMVCAALLPRSRHKEAIELLVSNLEKAPSVRRTDTMMAALRFLTGRDFGEHVLLWKDWWEEARMVGS
jgi:hypothetical protein